MPSLASSNIGRAYLATNPQEMFFDFWESSAGRLSPHSTQGPAIVDAKTLDTSANNSELPWVISPLPPEVPDLGLPSWVANHDI
jgi:hypothetical protein